MTLKNNKNGILAVLKIESEFGLIDVSINNNIKENNKKQLILMISRIFLQNFIF